MTTELDGLGDLLARLAHTQAGLLDLTAVNTQLAATALHAARTPKRTGELEAANTIQASPTGWGLVNGKPYAPPVYFGTRYTRPRPWLLDAARATEDSWLDQLTEHVQQLLNTNG